MRVIPKLNKLSEDEMKAWKEELEKLERDNINKDLTKQIRGGRGWIF